MWVYLKVGLYLGNRGHLRCGLVFLCVLRETAGLCDPHCENMFSLPLSEPAVYIMVPGGGRGGEGREEFCMMARNSISLSVIKVG